MRHLKLLLALCCSLTLLQIKCSGQKPQNSSKKIGGPCQGCEAVLEYGNKQLTAIDTLPAFSSNSPKIKIGGKVYQRDGKTPAAGVILYVYHTNRAGIYEKKGNEQGWAKTHGFIRGWVKTNQAGEYSFYTFRPGAYPNQREVAHIHLTIKEPNKNEYYADNFVFEDDPLLDQNIRKRLQNRCGSGIISLKMKAGILTGNRNLILGLNIPDYE